MKGIGFLIVLMVLINVTSCSNAEEGNGDTTATQTEGKKVSRVSKEEFNQFIADHNEVTIVDIRTPEEFAGGYVPGAVNMDFYGASFEDELATLDKTKPVLIYCHSGGRSSKALQMMKDKGFEHVLELEGGFSSWAP